MKERFTALDVLKRAQELIKNGHKFDATYTSCQAFCPWCAISAAKSQLDREHNTGVPLGECFKQVMLGQFKELPEDKPLIEAKTALKPFADAYGSSLTQKESVAILQKARKLLIN